MSDEYKTWCKEEKIAFLIGKPIVYTVIIEDRHCDTDVEVFNDLDDAVTYAKGICQEFARDPRDIIEQEIKGYVYFCSYSCEGDCVAVKSKIMDAWEGKYGAVS